MAREDPKRSLHGELAQLLVGLFPTSSGMSSFVRYFAGMELVVSELPADSVSCAAMADTIAAQLISHGLVTRELFLGFIGARPHRASDIRRVAAAWEIAISENDLVKQRATGLLRGLSVLVIAIIAVGLAYGVGLYGERGGPEDNAKPERAKLKPAKPEPPNEEDILFVDPDGPENMILTLVSRSSGESWKISVSKHRTAKSAARDIYAETFLGGNDMARESLADDGYRLCQSGVCHVDEVIETVLVQSAPVTIERWRSPEAASAAPSRVQCHEEICGSNPTPRPICNKQTMRGLVKSKIDRCSEGIFENSFLHRPLTIHLKTIGCRIVHIEWGTDERRRGLADCVTHGLHDLTFPVAPQGSAAHRQIFTFVFD